MWWNYMRNSKQVNSRYTAHHRRSSKEVKSMQLNYTNNIIAYNGACVQ